MEVTGKYLLNQAQSILKDRKNDSRSSTPEKGVSDPSASARGTEAAGRSSHQSRLLTLQNSLATMQKEFSKEQARLTYLKSHPGAITEDLRFENERLFPELEAGPLPESLQDTVSHKLEKLVHDLKGVQVEMENLYALNFHKAPASGFEPSDLGKLSQTSNINPNRVARLTE